MEVCLQRDIQPHSDLSREKSGPLFCPALERQCSSSRLSLPSLCRPALCAVEFVIFLCVCFVLPGHGARFSGPSPPCLLCSWRGLRCCWPCPFPALLLVFWCCLGCHGVLGLRHAFARGVCPSLALRAAFVRFWPTRLPGLEVLPSPGLGVCLCALSARCLSVFLVSWRILCFAPSLAAAFGRLLPALRLLPGS